MKFSPPPLPPSEGRLATLVRLRSCLSEVHSPPYPFFWYMVSPLISTTLLSPPSLLLETKVGVDVDRVAGLAGSAHELWGLPLQIAAALALLYWQARDSIYLCMTRCYLDHKCSFSYLLLSLIPFTLDPSLLSPLLPRILYMASC